MNTNPDPSLHALVHDALAAIDDDAPAFATPLRAIAASPSLLHALAEDEALHGALMPALRKLRPVALWVRDEVEAALRMKRVAFLDGAIGTLDPRAPTPQAEGRECWIEVRAEDAASRIAVLGRGWGLVVSGELHRTSFEALRRSAPLCALGAVIGRSLRLVPRVPLDLVVLEGGGGSGEAPGARVLWATEPGADLSAAALSHPAAGLTCSAEQALSWALRLATLRAPRV